MTTVEIPNLALAVTEIGIAILVAVLAYVATVVRGWLSQRAWLNDAAREEAREVMDSVLNNAVVYARHVADELVDSASLTVDSAALSAAISYAETNGPAALRALNVTPAALANLVTARLMAAYLGEDQATISTTVITPPSDT